MAQLKNTTINATTSVTVPTQATATTGGTARLKFNTDNGQNTLEFFDGNGWRPVTGYSQGLVGTGGQEINYIPGGGIVHMFTAVGGHTFTPTFTGTVSVLVVGGGGGGGSSWGGGGGGGGVILNRSFPVSAGVGYGVTVGGGGGGTADGGSSVFSGITASGGGQGGTWANSSPGALGTGTAGRPGSSGGGGANTGDGIDSRTRSYGGRGTEGQGYPGGSGVRFNADTENTHNGGGGGGAGGPGASAPDGRQNYRGSFRADNVCGGDGRADDLLGQTFYFGGGGGGGGHLGWGTFTGGIGGGGGGGYHHAGPYGGQGPFNPGNPITGGAQGRQFEGGGQALNTGAHCNVIVGGGNGGANTGGGSGAHGGTGGSGVVIVRY
jgi:hypothetical protein